MPAAAALQIRHFPALCFRAAVTTVNAEKRTVDVVWSTGAPVLRYDWLTDERYLEVLSLDPAHVRLARLNTGAPLLDAHSAWSVHDVIGVVEPKSAIVTGTEGRATVRFSKREAVEPIFRDVTDGVVTSTSVGYSVYEFRETRDAGPVPIRTAIDWEPYEISLVPMPADIGAQVRSANRADLQICVIRQAIGDTDRDRFLRHVRLRQSA